jgi:hypothetical protein
VVVDHGRPPQPLQTLPERSGAIGSSRVIFTGKVQKANAHTLGLLRTRREWPRRRRTAEKRDELAPPLYVVKAAY